MPGKHRKIKVVCPDCESERVIYKRGSMFEGMEKRCNRCANASRNGSLHGNWKGGRHVHSNGYIEVLLRPDDFFFPMANSHGYVSEHRLVMARHLKRCLLPWEVVHHKNGVRNDNRIENLELLPGRKYHIGDTLTKSLLKTMRKRILYLEGVLNKNGIRFNP